MKKWPRREEGRQGGWCSGPRENGFREERLHLLNTTEGQQSYRWNPLGNG